MHGKGRSGPRTTALRRTPATAGPSSAAQPARRPGARARGPEASGQGGEQHSCGRRVVCALDGKIGDFLAWSGLVITTCCYLPYIGANVLFLAAMRRRSAPHVKACITGNIALAIVMAALLVFTIIRYANDEVPESIAEFASAHSLIYLAAIWCADHR